MVSTRRKRAAASEVPASPKQRRRGRSVAPIPIPIPIPIPSNPPSQSLDNSSGYEKFRDTRIKENLERMQMLGIIDLSLKLKPFSSSSSSSSLSSSPARRRTRSPSVHKGIGRDLPPPRRSSRLQNAGPVSYAEIRGEKDTNSGRSGIALVEVGQREEVYTEEHTRLLGSCENAWTLFVDGYDNDGRRIYDQIKGKTCHQCRQKTLGYHTHCSKCNLVQGQFCGDCLYIRYGENVLEVEKNPNWVCPVCRGICNCSLCRKKKGWAPTGPLYRKVLGLGFKSVAHYLIQTRQSQTKSEDQISVQPSCSRKSLPFSDKEDYSLNALASKNVLNSESTYQNSDDTQKKSLPSGDTEEPFHPKNSVESDSDLNLDSDGKDSNNCNGKGDPCCTDESIVSNISNTAGENTAKLRNTTRVKEAAGVVEPRPDCIAGRLRKRDNR